MPVARLWIFITLGAIVLSLARESRAEVAAIRNSQSMEKAYYIACAGFCETIYRLAHQRFSSRVQQPGLQQEPTPLDLGRIEEEFVKVHLNTVFEEQLRALVHAN